MAVAAGGGVVVSGLQGQTVDARLKTLRLPRVSAGAAHQRDRAVVVGMLGGEVGVATDAIIGLMSGQFEFDRVHEQGNRLAGRVGLDQGVIAVTIEAITVLHPGEYRDHPQHPKRNQQGYTVFHFTYFPCKKSKRLSMFCQLFPKF